MPGSGASFPCGTPSHSRPFPSHNVRCGAALIPVFWPSGALAQDACTDEATDLIAGTTNIGDVNVCNHGTIFFV